MNALKIHIRQLKKQKGISAIKMAGLILGMLSTLLILEYVIYERSFDKGHGEDVYRVVYDRYGEEGLMWKTVNFFVPAGPYLKNKYPEVEDYVTFRTVFNPTFERQTELGEKVIFNEQRCYYATNSLFSVFRYPISRGVQNCLESPYAVAISERAAQKYFGKADPIGKELTFNHRESFTVTAVFKNLPPNGHLQSDFFFSFETLIARKPQMMNDWIGDGSNCYIKLKPGTDYKTFQKKFAPAMIADNYADQQRIQNQRDEIYIQPVRSIHLNSHLEYELEPPGNGKMISVLLVFSIFFLVIAWINFINLESARSIERAREIGVKRVNGSTRSMLVKQFITEAIAFNLICYLITILMYFALNPFYRTLTGIPREVSVLGLGFWSLFSLAVIVGIIVSTVYPAFILSSFKPVEVLRGRFVTSKQGFMLRKALVTFQFILSILLIAGTIVTFRQVDFLVQKDFGVSYKSKLVLKTPKRTAYGDEFYPKMELIIDKLKHQTNVTDYTLCSDVPGEEIRGFFGSYVKGDDPKYMNWFFSIQTDYRFANCFDAKLKAGRSFRIDDNPNARLLMINEAALKRYNFSNADEAVGKIVMGHDHQEWQIIGVYQDFHFYSVKTEPVPTCFTLQRNLKKFIVLDLSETPNHDQILASARNVYSEIFPDQPFEYFFLNDSVGNTLKPDKTFVYVFGVFSILAIVIALIGIVGLLLIFISQNLRAFGMRKVLGAETYNIFWNLSRQFIPQLVIAIAVGIPLSRFGLNRWISENYISHIEMKEMYFLIPALIVSLALTFVLAMITRKTYKMNVIDVINYE